MFDKFFDAISSFANELQKEKSTVKKVSVFTYEDFKKYTESVMEESYEVCKSTISLMKKSEMGGELPADDYWVVRQVFLNEAESPVKIPDSKEAFYGRIVNAKDIDSKFLEFMGGKKMKTFKISRED